MTGALVWSQAAGATNGEIRQALTVTAVDLGPAGRDNAYGFGLVQAKAALDYLGGGGGDPTDNPPTATISNPSDGATFASGVSISFAGSASDDEDGDLTADLVWTSDLDGEIGTGGSVSAVLSDGSHSITASVTDSAGNADSASVTITVGGGDTGGGDGITLSVSTYKSRGVQQADLSWSGATSTSVDVYRDGERVTTTANDGADTDSTGQKGGGSAAYQVCEAGTSTCSNTVNVCW
ncbi:MAG: hypothetical protein P8080_12685 [Gammaproteobacteria bacterium]